MIEGSIKSDKRNDDELSLKRFIMLIIVWVKYMLSRWKVILLAGVIGGVIGFLYSISKKPVYVGNLTFVLEEPQSNSLGAYAGLASQFGVDLGSNSGSGIFNADNIMEFLKSKMMIERVLLTDADWEGGRKTLADKYIDIYKLNASWKDKAAFADFSFPFNSSPDSLNRIQDSIMANLCSMIAKQNLLVDKPDKKLNFIDAAITTPNEHFSKIFIQRLVDEASKFYVQTKTRRSALTVNQLQAEADSVLSELNKKTYSSAMSLDMNENPVRKIATIQAESVTRDKMILQSMYAEVIKNLEVAKMTLSQNTPVILEVDVPRYPLQRKMVGKKVGIAVGLILGCFLMIVFLTLNRIVKTVME